MDTFTKLIIKGHAPQNYSTTSGIKLNVSLQGIGPTFRMIIVVDNSGEEVINSVDLIVDYNKKIYDFPKESIQLGIIMPHVPTKYFLKFSNISENGVAGEVKIMIIDKSSTAPLIVNKVKVPISELDIWILLNSFIYKLIFVIFILSDNQIKVNNTLNKNYLFILL